MTETSQTEDAPYEVFIKGETIDLVVPCERAIINDGWHRWFNDPEVTRFTGHGVYPNTAETQLAYLDEISNPKSRRLTLLILPKGMQRVVGVASLSSIDSTNQSAETAVVIGDRETTRGAIFWGMEAKARLAEHGFETMGLARISGGQATPLADWQRYQVLFGFRPEGIQRNAFRRGYHVWDVVLSSCTLEDYLRVREARSGAYWPGKEKLLELMRGVPKRSIVEDVREAIDGAVDAYVKDVSLT